MRRVIVENVTNEVQRLYSKDKVIADINTFRVMKLYYEKMTKSEELKMKYTQDKYINIIQLLTYQDKENNIIAGLYWNRKGRRFTYIMLEGTLWLVRLRKEKPIAFVEANDEIKTNLNRFRALLGEEIQYVTDYVFEYIATFLHMSKDEIAYVKRYIVKLI